MTVAGAKGALIGSLFVFTGLMVCPGAISSLNSGSRH